jgi:acetate kinase
MMTGAHRFAAMHVILTVNTGSSSVRLDAWRADAVDGVPLASHRHDRTDVDAVSLLEALRDLLPAAREWTLVHRVVHGGATLTAPCLIDARVEQAIEACAPLAPLHNPRALTWIRACRAVFGTTVRQVAVFDTAFFADLPAAARTYALPHALCAEHGIRRYGFHGLAHAALWQRWREHDGAADARVITLQLGGGCSAAAITGGRPLDTSMGFSPLEGLVMATRPGDLDAGLVLYLQRSLGLDPAAIERLLSETSGLLGIAGDSGDMRVLLARDDAEARLAIEVFLSPRAQIRRCLPGRTRRRRRDRLRRRRGRACPRDTRPHPRRPRLCRDRGRCGRQCSRHRPRRLHQRAADGGPGTCLHGRRGAPARRGCASVRRARRHAGGACLVNPLQALQAAGQSPWLDFIERGFVADGHLAALVDAGLVRGVTSNPAIFARALHGDSYRAALNALDDALPAPARYEALAIDDIRTAADVLRAVYEQSDGRDGFVSLEVTPALAHDTAGTVREATRLWQAVARPNLMLKVPGTGAGMPAVSELVTRGINVNVTLLFARDADELRRHRRVLARLQLPRAGMIYLQDNPLLREPLKPSTSRAGCSGTGARAPASRFTTCTSTG